MPEFSPDNNGPTVAEIFHAFRDTSIATITGLKLLLEECADLRAELVTIVEANHDGSGLFSARQQDHILELKRAAQDMDAVLDSLPDEESASQDNGDES